LQRHLFPGALKQSANGHDHCEYDQVPHIRHTVANDAGQNHETGTDESQNRQYETADDTLFLFFAHPLDENGEVHQVDGDDGKFGGVEDEGTGPHACQIGAVEVQEPGSGNQQRKDSGVVGHVGLGVQLIIYLGSGTAVSVSHGVHTAGAA